jgi:hypothetical protein
MFFSEHGIFSVSTWGHGKDRENAKNIIAKNKKYIILARLDGPQLSFYIIR